MRIQIDFYMLPRLEFAKAMEGFLSYCALDRARAEIVMCRAGKFGLDIDDGLVSVFGTSYAAGFAYAEIYAARKAEQAKKPRLARPNVSCDYQLPNVILHTSRR